MSESAIRYRKTPKSPFIAGNVLLAALAASIVFFGPDPWSIATVLLVVLCLAVGGLLTLLPFILDQFALLNLNRARSTQASVNLRGAIEKADELVEELNAHRTQENPLRLVSERLPQLVEEKLNEAIERNLRKTDERPAEILKKIEPLPTLANDLEHLRDEVRVLSIHAATREFLEAGLSRLSEEIHRVELKLDALRRTQFYGIHESDPSPATTPDASQSSAQPAEPTPAQPAEPIPAPGELRPTGDDSHGTEDASESDELGDFDDSEEWEEEEMYPGEFEFPEDTTETDPSESDTPPPAKTEGHGVAKVIVSAFVGIQNGIYLRGDGPGLSPDKGTRLEMTGIGEWIWAGEIDREFTGEIFLNDQTPSDLGAFPIHPGDLLKLNPSFPQEAKP